MKKIIIVNGLIAGAIAGGMLMITMPLYENGTLHIENGHWLGYTTMVAAFSLIFVGVKSYRDNYAAGKITFWNGLKIGLLITLIASLMYAVSWEITLKTMKGNFIAQIGEQSMSKLKAEGASPASLEEAKEKMKNFEMLYKNPIFRFTITLAEIAPVGIVISLISAALFRRKEFLPASEQSVAQ